MGFEVAPEPIGRSRATAPKVVATILLVAAVVGVALLTSQGDAPASDPLLAVRSANPIAQASADLAARTEPGPSGRPTAQPLRGPGTVDCNDVDAFRCGLIIAAAVKQLRVAVDGIDEIGVWTSLLCHDPSDCPPSRFVGFRPLGSAFVILRPGRTAWVNVVEPTPRPGRAPLASGPIGWVIRWVDAAPQ